MKKGEFVPASRPVPGGHAEVLALAFPLVLSTGAMSVQQFVDRMFLTWYSAEAVAAAMPAGMLNFALLSLFIGTAGYVTTFVAQYHGAGHNRRIGPVIWQGLYIALIGGLAIAALAPFSEAIFAAVGHDPALQAFERDYFSILCLGSLPPIASAALGGFFSGRGNPWPVMWVNVLATIFNLVLDYGLIFGRFGLPALGVSGAALATVLAGVLACAVYAVLIFRGSHDRSCHVIRGWRFDKELFRRLLQFGLPSGIQFFIDMAGFAAFILLVGRLGTINMAATTIAFNINTLAFMPMIGLGIAISVLVGQYQGAGNSDLAEKSVWSGFGLTAAYIGGMALAYVLVPQVFIAPFAARSDPAAFGEIFELTVILLRFVAVFSIFDAMNIVFASAIKGAGDTRFVMLMLLVVSLGALVLPTYGAIAWLNQGIMACWIIVSVYIGILGLVFLQRFKGGKWKDMQVIEEPLGAEL